MSYELPQQFDATIAAQHDEVEGAFREAGIDVESRKNLRTWASSNLTEQVHEALSNIK